ncbi:Uncharacterized protein Fot_41111 [Forsythia ovata]|uniref:Uncharacterized protein n=1 Tax=Forsythia ovata TaxID=205694 RepID=A0ABD1RHB9_9LAMI
MSQLAVAARKRSGPSRKPTLIQSQMVLMKGNRVPIRVVRIRASPPPPRRPLILPPSPPLAPSVPAPKWVELVKKYRLSGLIGSDCYKAKYLGLPICSWVWAHL